MRGEVRIDGDDAIGSRERDPLAVWMNR
jgi:hypothetical protein